MENLLGSELVRTYRGLRAEGEIYSREVSKREQTFEYSVSNCNWTRI